MRELVMKILFVDIAIDGHHENYMKLLANSDAYDSIFILPERPTVFKHKTYLSGFNPSKKWDIHGYLKWIGLIKQVSKSENVDIVHLLCADSVYRFCGMGFKRALKDVKIVATQHLIRESRLRMWCFKRFSKHLQMLLVHTEYACNQLKNYGINKVSYNHYPITFEENVHINQTAAKNYWGIKQTPVFAALGGTRRDKGLDLLLEALKGIDKNFALLIVGAESQISSESIKSLAEQYMDKVYIFLNNITDREFNYAATASDCIVLPYRKEFNGASGPLTYGIWNEKYIIGPNHGSLGDIIRTYEIGSTFEVENVESLRDTINFFIDNYPFKYSKKYYEYKKKLDAATFINRHITLYKEL